MSVSAFFSIRAPWANATSLGGPQHHRLTSVYNSESDQKKNVLTHYQKGLAQLGYVTVFQKTILSLDQGGGKRIL